jgi:hypothetical protein
MSDDVWVEAAYSFPSLYSIRIPGANNHYARATPAPGPGTIRLALIKTSFLVFGENTTRRKIFPVVRDAEVKISPPHRISITRQIVKMQKFDQKKKISVESIGYREYCHTDGKLVIGMKVPRRLANRVMDLFSHIGYWGEASSLAQCESVKITDNFDYDSVCPLDKTGDFQMRGLFTCFLSEVTNSTSWEDILVGKKEMLVLSLYVFPLKLCEQRRGNTLLLHCSQRG